MATEVLYTFLSSHSVMSSFVSQFVTPLFIDAAHAFCGEFQTVSHYKISLLILTDAAAGWSQMIRPLWSSFVNQRDVNQTSESSLVLLHLPV